MNDELNRPINMSGGSQRDSEHSDTTLLLQMARGDQQALQQLYARYRGSLWRYIWRLVDDGDKKSTTLYWLPPWSNEWHGGERERHYASITIVPTGAHDALWRAILEQTTGKDVYHFAIAIY
jgi:hypothetical protein